MWSWTQSSARRQCPSSSTRSPSLRQRGCSSAKRLCPRWSACQLSRCAVTITLTSARCMTMRMLSASKSAAQGLLAFTTLHVLAPALLLLPTAAGIVAPSHPCLCCMGGFPQDCHGGDWQALCINALHQGHHHCAAVHAQQGVRIAAQFCERAPACSTIHHSLRVHL